MGCIDCNGTFNIENADSEDIGFGSIMYVCPYCGSSRIREV